MIRDTLKQESGKGLFLGGLKLPMASAELGLIDEYEFVVQPRLAGLGPTSFAGLSKPLDSGLVSRLEFGSGAVAMRYEPRESPFRPATNMEAVQRPLKEDHDGEAI